MSSLQLKIFKSYVRVNLAGLDIGKKIVVVICHHHPQNRIFEKRKEKKKLVCYHSVTHTPFFPFESYIIQYSKSSQVPLHQSRKFRDRSSHLQSLGFSISPSSFLVHLFFHLFFCFRYFVCPVLIFLIILNSILIYEVDDIDDVDGGGAIGHTGIGFASESRIQGGLLASS